MYSNLGHNYDMLSEYPSLYMNLDLSQFGESHTQNVLIWEGLQEMLIIFTKLYHLRLFEIGEYEEDVKKDVKRLRT